MRLSIPWGESEPAGNGEDDGIFELPLARFRQLYETVHSCAPG